MKKSIKRILAVAIAVVMLALMIPFSASAANDFTFTLNCDKEDFTFTVYQLATIDTTTGTVTVNSGVAADVANAITKGMTSEDIIAAADATDQTGTVIDTVDSTASPKTITNAAGYYYIKCTTAPEEAVAASSMVITQSSNGEWVMNAGTIDIGAKVGSVKLDKKIVDGEKEVTYSSASAGDTVTFKLTSTVPGNVADKVDEFIITDTMEEGLSAEDVNIVSVKQKGIDLEYTKVEAEDCTFGIKIADDVVSSDAFYTNGKVEVVYTTTLTNEATVGNDSNDNTVGLVYNYAGGRKSIVGPTVQVFTFDVKVIKIDAKNLDKVLKDAVFELYADEACTELLAEGTTNADGETTFGDIKLNEGTYYVKETKAPKGYVLDDTVKAVQIDAEYDTTGAKVTVEYADNANGVIKVTNIAISAPATGDMGTILFTVVGAALIVIAGVMLVLLTSKKRAK